MEREYVLSERGHLSRSVSKALNSSEEFFFFPYFVFLIYIQNK